MCGRLSELRSLLACIFVALEASWLSFSPLHLATMGDREQIPDLTDDEVWAAMVRDGVARSTLEIARKNVQLTLSLIDMREEEITIGVRLHQIDVADAQRERLVLLGRRKNAKVFLSLVERRQVEVKHMRQVNAIHAINEHRYHVERSGRVVDQIDLDLWSVLDQG